MTEMENRIGAVCAFAGCALLGVGTVMHPMGADPNNAVAAFTEYAADKNWIAGHLAQFAGFALLVAAMLVLAQQLRESAPAGLRQLAAGGAIASLALGAALQAVDGIALKAMVDVWAAAPAPEKEAAFHAAFAVRQLEIGLASLLSMVTGVTGGLFGALLRLDRRYPPWIGVVAVAGGIGFAVAGVAMAFTGFSPLVMSLQMPASLLLLTWIVAVAAIMWRQAEKAAG